MTSGAPSGYDPSDYPPFAVTVDVAVFTIRNDTLHVLLIERGEEPFRGALALPGGFVKPGEDLDQAAARELAEETGLRDGSWHLEQLASYGAPGRDPRMRVVTVAYWAICADLPALRGGGDAVAAVLTPVEAIEGGAVRLAFDHERIVRDAVERTRSSWSTPPSRPGSALQSLRSPSFVESTKRFGAHTSIRATSSATSSLAAPSRNESTCRPRLRPAGGRRASLWSIRPSTSFNEPPAAPLARVPAKRRHREPGKGRVPSAAPPSEPIVKSPAGEDDQT